METVTSLLTITKVSLKAETSNTEPTKDDRGALGTGNDRSKTVDKSKL